MTRKASGVKSGSIRIGCAGWSLRSVQAALFGDGDSHLARYATRFDTVEINSSFYRPHKPQTYARWAEAVPRNFRFSVKLPKTITHQARLVDADAAIGRFADEIAGLCGKLGGVLVQLPPSLIHHSAIADAFFGVLRNRISSPLACEPRHPSWFTPDVDKLWRTHAVTRVAADPARFPEAAQVGGQGRWRYWRWHGSPRIYYSAYEDAMLQALAAELRMHAQAGQTAWCIFDNTALGHAATDAIRLQELCGVVVG